MKRIIFVIFLGLISVGCSKINERKLLYKCSGEMTFYGKSNGVKNNNIVASLYIGSDSVVSQSQKYKICSDLPTQITFADDCLNPIYSGSFDYALKTYVENKKSNNEFMSSYSYNSTCQQVDLPH